MTDAKPPKFDPDRRSAIHRLRDVESLTRSELDQLPFGVIQVDRHGKVLAYNATEAKLADREPKDVLGKNFFTEVAPCTNVDSFGKRFREGVERGKLEDTFPFRFPFSKGAVHVLVTLHYDGGEHAWIFVDANPGA